MGFKPKIMVIDDNEIIRNLLQELLTRKGFDIFLFASGLSAIEKAKDVQPNIAIVDLMLPDISGLEVIKQIKNVSPLTDAIIITGYSSYIFTTRSNELTNLLRINFYFLYLRGKL